MCRGVVEVHKAGDAKQNIVQFSAVRHALPGRHPVCALPTSRHLPLAPHCWWRLQHHPAACSVDHNRPPSGSTPASRHHHHVSRISCVSTNTQFKREIFPQELPSLFMHGFRLPSANAHYKPGSSFEKPLPVPEPGTAKLWLWLPAVPTHLPDTWVIPARAGTDFAQRPTETWGPAGASGSARDQKCGWENGKVGGEVEKTKTKNILSLQKGKVWWSLGEIRS